MDKNFTESLAAQAATHGFTDWEVYQHMSNQFSVSVFEGQIKEYKVTASASLNFRGTLHGRMGYANTENFSPEIIPTLLAHAATHAGLIEEDEPEKLFPGSAAYPTVDTYNSALNETTAAEKIALALALEAACKTADPRVTTVDYCYIGSGEETLHMANSYGLDVQHTGNYGMAYVSACVTCPTTGEVKTHGDHWEGRDFAALDVQALARTTVAGALAQLGAAPAESGCFPVVLENRAVCALFGAFNGVFFAENAQKGFSLLAGKEGETIAAPCVTLRDDGVCPHSLHSAPFDGEGVATQQTTVIENGVLRTLLYNTKSAAKAGKQSTGNASRGNSIGTTCTNFYLSPGETPPEVLRSGITHGLLINRFSGLHAGTNAISGDFSLLAGGFFIEDGQISRPVDQITLSGNIFSLLQNIREVASDLHFEWNTGMPSLRVDGLQVSGV